jgi:hypothetical protein
MGEIVMQNGDWQSIAGAGEPRDALVNNHTAEYLLGAPLLADFLEEGSGVPVGSGADEAMGKTGHPLAVPAAAIYAILMSENAVDDRQR